MYNQFVKNMDRYLTLNEDSSSLKDYRYRLAKSLEPLKSIQTFKELKNTNIEHYKELQHILWKISNSTDKYPAFKAFA